MEVARTIIIKAQLEIMERKVFWLPNERPRTPSSENKPEKAICEMALPSTNDWNKTTKRSKEWW
jgi:hypothetical protein